MVFVTQSCGDKIIASNVINFDENGVKMQLNKIMKIVKFKVKMQFLKITLFFIKSWIFFKNAVFWPKKAHISLKTAYF